MFHKEGFNSIAIALAFVTTGFLLTDRFVGLTWLQYTLYGALFLLLVIILQFFRNPKRHTVEGDGHVVAPVDGKVVVIEEVFEKEYFKDKRIQVSIFMSPLNVHVTRYGLSGLVKFSKYHPGKFLVAWHPKASEENERTTVVVENPVFGAVLYRQIAGALARRIVCYSKKGDRAEQGGEMGFIKFGSRVDVYLPIGTEVPLELGQKVVGGESIIAKFTSK